MREHFLNNINELHTAPTEIFHKALSQQQMGHAYLLYGYEGIGKEAYAIELASHMLCEKGPLQKCGTCPSCRQMAKLWHPDFHYIFPVPSKSKVKTEDIVKAVESKAQNPFSRISFNEKNGFIGIEAVRELKNALYKHPQQGKIKIALIQDIDSMRVEAANALLKILEEPPPYVYFILVTSKISKLLPTILSRCQLIHFDKPASDNIHSVLKPYLTETEEAHLTGSLRLAECNIKKALYYLKNDFSMLQSSSFNFVKHLITANWSEAHSILIEMTKDHTGLNIFLEFTASNFSDLSYISLKLPDFVKNRKLLDLPTAGINISSDHYIYNHLISLIIQFKDSLDSVYNYNSFLLMEEMFHEIRKHINNN